MLGCFFLIVEMFLCKWSSACFCLTEITCLNKSKYIYFKGKYNQRTILELLNNGIFSIMELCFFYNSFQLLWTEFKSCTTISKAVGSCLCLNVLPLVWGFQQRQTPLVLDHLVEQRVTSCQILSWCQLEENTQQVVTTFILQQIQHYKAHRFSRKCFLSARRLFQHVCSCICFRRGMRCLCDILFLKERVKSNTSFLPFC